MDTASPRQFDLSKQANDSKHKHLQVNRVKIREPGCDQRTGFTFSSPRVTATGLGRCNNELGPISASTANPSDSTRTTRPRVFSSAPDPAASNRGRENSICRMLPIGNLLGETTKAPEALQSRV